MHTEFGFSFLPKNLHINHESFGVWNEDFTYKTDRYIVFVLRAGTFNMANPIIR